MKKLYQKAKQWYEEKKLGRLVKQLYQDNKYDELAELVFKSNPESLQQLILKEWEKCVIEKRRNWLKENQKNIKKSENPLKDAYTALFIKYFNISPEEAKIVKETKNKLVIHSTNNCPILNACLKIEKDPIIICKNVYERPSQDFVLHIDSRLKFTRNYNCIRPRTPYCEEYIYI